MQPVSKLDNLESAIREAYGCECRYFGSVWVRQVFDGHIAWAGIVEIFTLLNCPKAEHCYAWEEAEDGQNKVTIVLCMPPVTSAETAVQAALATKARQQGIAA